MDIIEEYFNKLKKGIDSLDRNMINKIIDVLFEAWKKEKQIFILGNGGSASTASHFACDIGKGTLGRKYNDKNLRRFKVFSLTDNVATITAYGNDLSFDDIFSQQLKNSVCEEDVVIVITGSGNSPNVIKAVEVAKQSKAITIAFLGFNGGKVKNMVEYPLLFRDTHFGRIEDSHLILCHLISSALYEKVNHPKV